MIVRNINSFETDNLLSIKCWFSYPQPGEMHINLEETEIFLETQGEKRLWFGYPNEKNSAQITEPEKIKYILENVKKHQELVNYQFDKFINLMN